MSPVDVTLESPPATAAAPAAAATPVSSATSETASRTICPSEVAAVA